MNDWYNHPPEPPELPECCGEPMRVDEHGHCHCDTCQKEIQVDVTADIDCDGWECPACGECWPCSCERYAQERMELSECPHGRRPEDCNACYAQSDFEYDAARERSAFGK